MRTFTLLLLSAAVGCALAGHGDVLVSSSFHFGQDGWSLFGPGDLVIGDRSGMLFGSDKGKTVWYRRAPRSVSLRSHTARAQVLQRPQLLPRRQMLRLQWHPFLSPWSQRIHVEWQGYDSGLGRHP